MWPQSRDPGTRGPVLDRASVRKLVGGVKSVRKISKRCKKPGLVFAEKFRRCLENLTKNGDFRAVTVPHIVIVLYFAIVRKLVGRVKTEECPKHLETMHSRLSQLERSDVKFLTKTTNVDVYFTTF